MTYDLHNSIETALGEKTTGWRNKLIDDTYLKYVMPERLKLELGTN
jgi:hypothetical protein